MLLLLGDGALQQLRESLSLLRLFMYCKHQRCSRTKTTHYELQKWYENVHFLSSCPLEEPDWRQRSREAGVTSRLYWDIWRHMHWWDPAGGSKETPQLTSAPTQKDPPDPELTQNQPRQTQNQQVPGNSPGDNEPMKAELGSETLFISSNTDRNKLQQIVRNIKTSWTPVTSQWYHRGRSQTFWMSAGTNIYVCRNFK